MIKKFLFSIILLSVLFLEAQTTYYFSSSTGNDSNSGISELNPFQTIVKLNSLSLSPGDKILFKKGDTFIGAITVNYSGVENAPIIFDSFGIGAKPILSGSNGNNGVPDPLATINIVGKGYLEFRNLHIENERFDKATGADDDKSFGIYYRSFKTLPSSGNFEDGQMAKHLYFSNLTLQNIYSLGSSGTAFDDIRTSGIYIWDAFVNDLIVENCYFTNIERVGIWLRRYVSDAVIKDNQFINLGGSGAIFSVSKRVLFERNLMRFTGSNSDARMTARGSGMWVFASDDVVAQYNISQHARGNGDSSGMHVDYSNKNVLFQYNYLEDSAGGFCETLGNNDNVIWRYNISVNEGTDARGGKNNLLWVSDYAGNNPINSKNVYVYNNTIYQGRDYDNAISDSRILIKSTDLFFYNNIIQLETGAKLGQKSYSYNVTNSNFKKNILFGGTINSNFKNLDANRKEVDPRFIAPGRKHFSGYKILSFSPAKSDAFSFVEPVFPLAGQGIFANITSKATKDIFGNQVNLLATTNIGADNSTGNSSFPTETTFEAESAIFTGSQVNCVNASGGSSINVTSSGSSLTFNSITVPETDTYLVKVYYLNPTMSSLKMTINDGATETILLPGSNGFCFELGNPTSFHIITSLQAGVNSIKFEQAVIDKIEVVSVENATLNLTDNLLEKRIDAYLEKSVISKNESVRLLLYNNYFDSNQPIELSIFDVTGKILLKKSCEITDISAPANHLGSGLKIVTAKIGNSIIVKKLIVE
ncbi:hypothetical protein [Polaribacter sp.]|uniref:hypothetical protein n=1 Tax=Polaribacter sp. TaxID=1920175 RepID=UPI004047A72D